MNNGGKRAGAGRKEGAANIKTREIANKAALEGLTPLEYLLQVMRKETPEADETLIQLQAKRLDAAKAAAPYIHPRLAAIEHSGSVSHEHELYLHELK
jgi:hypothetical protein